MQRRRCSGTVPNSALHFISYMFTGYHVRWFRLPQRHFKQYLSVGSRTADGTAWILNFRWTAHVLSDGEANVLPRLRKTSNKRQRLSCRSYSWTLCMKPILSQSFPHGNAIDSAQTRGVASSDSSRQQSVPSVRKDDVPVLVRSGYSRTTTFRQVNNATCVLVTVPSHS